MIELPSDIRPNGATPRLIDNGFAQQGVGGSSTRIERPGNRFEVELTFAPLSGDGARIFIARLNRAKAAGLRLPYPLQGVAQGNPGAPVVDGTDSAGRVLKLRGLIAGYPVKEGYWLTLTDAGGVKYLHQVSALAIADATGRAVLAVEPPLRIFPADAAAVELAKPVIEGMVTSDLTWALSPGALISGIAITLREMA